MKVSPTLCIDVSAEVAVEAEKVAEDKQEAGESKSKEVEKSTTPNDEVESLSSAVMSALNISPLSGSGAGQRVGKGTQVQANPMLVMDASCYVQSPMRAQQLIFCFVVNTQYIRPLHCLKNVSLSNAHSIHAHLGRLTSVDGQIG